FILVVLVEPLLETADALGKVAHEIGDLAAAEQQHDKNDHDQDLPDADTHVMKLLSLRPSSEQGRTARRRPRSLAKYTVRRNGRPQPRAGSRWTARLYLSDPVQGEDE